MRRDKAIKRISLWIFGITAGFVLIVRPAGAQLQTDPCSEALGYVGCANLGKPNPSQQRIILHWAAVAISPAKLVAGASHGQNSQAAAEQAALSVCRGQGASDCRVLQWVRNECTGLAISYSAKEYGWADASTRNGAAASALARCKANGVKNCVLITAPCAVDDARWSSPLPLPIGEKATSVDPRAVGTWELSINPGVWVWTIGPNGTYELHSEAGDGAPSQAGTISASGGKWSVHALNLPWNDGGEYSFPAPGTMTVAGRLGTGQWRRVH